MSRDSNICPIIMPFIIGIVLGLIAKFTNGREFLYYFPLFADVMGRFGIWVWVAALISIILIQLIQAEIIVNPYEKLLNI